MTSPYQQLLEHARAAQHAIDAQRQSAADTAAKVAAARQAVTPAPPAAGGQHDSAAP